MLQEYNALSKQYFLYDLRAFKLGMGIGFEPIVEISVYWVSVSFLNRYQTRYF